MARYESQIKPKVKDFVAKAKAMLESGEMKSDVKETGYAKYRDSLVEQAKQREAIKSEKMPERERSDREKYGVPLASILGAILGMSGDGGTHRAGRKFVQGLSGIRGERDQKHALAFEGERAGKLGILDAKRKSDEELYKLDSEQEALKDKRTRQEATDSHNKQVDFYEMMAELGAKDQRDITNALNDRIQNRLEDKSGAKAPKQPPNIIKMSHDDAAKAKVADKKAELEHYKTAGTTKDVPTYNDDGTMTYSTVPVEGQEYKGEPPTALELYLKNYAHTISDSRARDSISTILSGGQWPPPQGVLPRQGMITPQQDELMRKQYPDWDDRSEAEKLELLTLLGM